MLLTIISADYIGFIAGILTSVSSLPQLIKILKEKKADDISVPMLLALIAGVTLWTWYGIKQEDAPIIYTNAFSLLLNSFLLFFKFKYSRSKSLIS